GEYYDKDAAVAKNGTVNEPLLAALLDNEFLQQPLPKTTGPELFNLAYLQSAQLRSGATELDLEDIMATLNQFTARTIVQAIQPLLNSTTQSKIFISGGGIHNPLLIQSIQRELPGVEILTTEAKGINPDAKEAILFAILANETVAGNAESFPSGLDNFPAINMGKVSFPG
ncbi:MAG: anhydro-N-acetylmuramic acid kinase, partial [Chitinophagaceae bacterium]